MSYLTRDRAFKLIACPKCGAGSGVRCLKADGTKRKSVHRERFLSRETVSFSRADAAEADFYRGEAWRRLRYKALLSAEGRCQACGARPGRGASLHVDHIKPRSRFPALQLDPANLQVLCEDCNLGKGAYDQTDWRKS